MLSILLILVSSVNLALLLAIPFELLIWFSYLYISKVKFRQIRKNKQSLVLYSNDLGQLERLIFGASNAHLAMLTVLVALMGILSMDWIWVYLVMVVWNGVISASTALMMKFNHFGEVI